MEHIISILPLLRLQELVWLYMKYQQSVEAGQFGELMAGIWVTLFTIIDVLGFFQITQPASGYQTRSIFSRITSIYLFLHRQRTTLKQQKNLRIIYKIQPQAHHYRSLNIPP